METSAKLDIHHVPADGVEDADESFTLAERYALLTDDELEQTVEEEAQAEVVSSAYEGIPLDKAQLKEMLRRTYRKIREDHASVRATAEVAV